MTPMRCWKHLASFCIEVSPYNYKLGFKVMDIVIFIGALAVFGLNAWVGCKFVFDSAFVARLRMAYIAVLVAAGVIAALTTFGYEYYPNANTRIRGWPVAGGLLGGVLRTMRRRAKITPRIFYFSGSAAVKTGSASPSAALATSASLFAGSVAEAAVGATYNPGTSALTAVYFACSSADIGGRS